jgi:hypothetical protein
MNLNWWIIVLLLVTLYLLLVVALPLGLSAAVSYRTLHTGRNCPLCRGETLPLISRWTRALTRLSRRYVFGRRWCSACGWEGVCRQPVLELAAERTPPGFPIIDPARRPQARRLDTPAEREPDAETEQESAADPVATGERTHPAVTLRSLEVDGTPWRVMVRCWRDTERWHGRILFAGPSGRTWTDPLVPLTGRSPDEVLGRASALSDRTLACRVRDLASS